MGKVRKANPVKLVMGLIFKEESVLKKAETILKRKFGAVDYESSILPFNFTDYYEFEFGSNLKKKFLSFSNLIYPQELVKIKLFTNRVEGKFSRLGLRLVNIDPGYLDSAKYILATTKDYIHRIYLDKGIFAEITLYFKHNTFLPGEWTYQDYKTKEYIDILTRIREIYGQQLKKICALPLI
ncbi:MAG: DUF4416 family protein [Candidatus Omnitrophota bacterium]|jgi:hypothetical protein